MVSDQAASLFAAVPLVPPDPILGVTEAFNRDGCNSKVNLGVGVYQNALGAVPLLHVVQEAEQMLLDSETSKSYLPIDGLRAYNQAVLELLFGVGSTVLEQQRAVCIQAPGGTGAVRLAADFLSRCATDSTVWISVPTWENHRAILEAAGVKVAEYRYYDSKTHGLDFDGMYADLQNAEPGDTVLLHACCHNPTGVDLDANQWRSVVEICHSRSLVPLLDFAYQGFAAGVEQDALAVRSFADSGMDLLIASSFSKSFSLYRERVGALTLVANSGEAAARALSNVKRIARANYSSPPAHGAQVVAAVLGSPDLRSRWVCEVDEMRERILSMREQFVAALRGNGATVDFEFINAQRGMFSYTGLTAQHAQWLRSERSVYILDSGRICLAALNPNNVGYVAESVAMALLAA